MVAANADTPIIFSLSPGQVGDVPEGKKLLCAWENSDKPTFLLMDRTYEADKTGELLKSLCRIPIVPPKRNRLDPWEYDRIHYRRRNEEALRRAGVTRRIRPYDLHHALATEAIAADVDIGTVARLMGHSSPSMILMHYQHVMDSRSGLRWKPCRTCPCAQAHVPKQKSPCGGIRKGLKKLVGRAGIEPATLCLKGRYSTY